MRHAKTDWNGRGIVQGRLDVPINAEGAAQAAAWTRAFADLSLGAVYSSSLKRTIETAEIVVGGLHPVERVADLDEWHMGEWQGRPRVEMMEHIRELDDRPKGGETYREMIDRSWRSISEIFARHSSEGRDVLVVTHGGVIKAALAKLGALSFEGLVPARAPVNCAVAVLRGRNGGLALERAGLTGADAGTLIGTNTR